MLGAGDQRRRAALVGQTLAYSVEDLMELARQAKLCCYCRAPLAFDLSFDHKTALARNGRHALDNLALCCRRCQMLKGRLNSDEFTALLSFLSQLHPAARQDVECRLLAGGRRYCRR